MRSRPPLLSIVTGHWNRHEAIAALARSIAKHTPPVDYEFLISDCSDVPFDPAAVPAAAPFTRVIRDWPKVSMAHGYNIAFRQAQGNYVLWLNDDCEVTPGYAITTYEFMRHHPEVGLGALYYRSEATGLYRVSLFQDMIYANYGILPIELGNRLGWFDEDLRMYGTDNALCFAVLADGRMVAQIPGVKINHHPVHDSQRRSNELMCPMSPAKLMAKWQNRMPRCHTTYQKFRHLIGLLEIP